MSDTPTTREPWTELEEWKALLINLRHGATLDRVDSDRLAQVVGGLSFRIARLKQEMS